MVKAFAWLVAHKKINTNDMVQLRRPFKALTPNLFLFFSFLIGKKDVYYKGKKIHSEYNKSANNAIKKKEGLTKNDTPQRALIQSKKIYNRERAQNYKQFGLSPQITKKSKLNSLIRKLFIIKHPIIPFFPNRPEKTQRSNPPSLFLFPTHKRPMLTSE